MDNIKETAQLLQTSLDQQYNADVAANENARRLAEQQLMYGQEKAGTLYSGIPTWQRANLASTYAQKLAGIDSSYAKSKVNLWNSVQDTIDQINAYNDASVKLGGVASNYSTTTPTLGSGSGTPIYLNGKWYTYSNGQLKEVQ